MKLSAIRRALLLANIFNLLVALYFIIIAIVALVELRWYHQLTITVKVRYLLTSVTSYFAFFILILAGLLLLAIFVMSTIRLSPKTYVSPLGEDAIAVEDQPQAGDNNITNGQPPTTGGAGAGDTTNHHHQLKSNETPQLSSAEIIGTTPLRSNTISHHHQQDHPPSNRLLMKRRLVLRDEIYDLNEDGGTTASVCCSILVHLITATCLVIILIIWLFNTGELVRDAISSQLDVAYMKYQFTNRSNYYTIAIDGMQDINNCCGSLEYTDFPHRGAGLSNGHYPGSCCGKNIYGVNARVVCTPDEIWRSKQTTGCTTVLANYYDLISILVVPVALASLFVTITIIALITILKGNSHLLSHLQLDELPATSQSLHHHRNLASTIPKRKRNQQLAATEITGIN